MRHKKKGRKLGRKVGNRRALLMNLASQMITHNNNISYNIEKPEENLVNLEKIIHHKDFIKYSEASKDLVKNLL